MAKELEGIIDYVVKTCFDYYNSKKGHNPKIRLDNLWENCGLVVKRSGKGKEPLKPKLAEKRKREYGTDLLLHLPDGLCPDHFRKKKKEIEFALNSKVEFEDVNGNLLIRAYKLYEYLPFSYPIKWPVKTKGMLAPIIIGYTAGGGIEVFDLVDGPHMSISGETRGGKSNLLNVIFATLIPNSRVNLNVIDMKRVDFPYLKGYANHAVTLGQAEAMVERLHAELFRRLDLFSNAGVCKIQDYSGDLPIEVLAIDEFSQISPVLAKNKIDKEQREYIHSMLIDILCLAASVGIHVILCTQRPDRDILPGQLKANIPAKICFHVTTVVNSVVAIDNPRAAFLPKVRGRGIFKYDEFREFQALHLPIEIAQELVKLTPPKIHQPTIVNNVASKPTEMLIP